MPQAAHSSSRRPEWGWGVATRTTKGRCGWRQEEGERREGGGEEGDRDVALIKIKYFSCSPNCAADAKTVAQGGTSTGKECTEEQRKAKEGRRGGG